MEKRGLKYHRGRVGEALREEIETLVEGELADPRIGLVSVTAVHIADDGRSAQVWVNVEGDDEDAERERASLSWHATLKSARVELPGATRFERFLVRSRNPHATAPQVVAGWPDGPYWPKDRRHLKHRHLKHRHEHFKHAHLKKTGKPDPDQDSC